MFGNRQFRVPVSTGLHVGLKVGGTVDFGIVVLDVGIKRGGIGRDVNSIRSMKVCGSQWYR